MRPSRTTRWLAAFLLMLTAPSVVAAQDVGTAAMSPMADMPAEHVHEHGSHDDMVVPLHPVLLTGYGAGGFTITTAVPEAQAFFSNGMELAAAFAHPAAVAAMKEAVRLDPACAMCKWGEALVDGPTINDPKDQKERVPLSALVQAAAAQVHASGTAREQALIAALAARYRPGASPPAADKAYAAAMSAVQAQYPADDEIAVLTADAMMVAASREQDLRPAVALLETVLARHPDHTPAIHFYIHATEMIGAPQRAEAYANRLEGLAPNASHLVHMPSHTFFWLGRYQEAADANARAVAIGERQAKALGAAAPEGVWGLPYHAHNVIFGLGGAMMAGDATTALSLARPLIAHAQTGTRAKPFMQMLAASGYFALARFDPVAMLAAPEPKLPYMRAAWHYGRGEAFAAAGNPGAVQAEIAAIPKHIAGEGRSRAPGQMLGIVRAVLEGRVAMLENRPQAAAKAFAAAARIEETRDFSRFSDPPAFWYPVRRDVAAALLAAGDKPGAVAAAEASLRLRPRDPAALQILARAR